GSLSFYPSRFTLPCPLSCPRSFATRRSSDLARADRGRRRPPQRAHRERPLGASEQRRGRAAAGPRAAPRARRLLGGAGHARRGEDRKSTRLNSSHVSISYAVFCLKKKKSQH